MKRRGSPREGERIDSAERSGAAADDARFSQLLTPRGRWIGRLSIVLATLIAYSPLRTAQFIWDDPDYIINNWTLRSLHGLWSIWAHPYSIPQYYPLVHTTFWLEFHLWDWFGLGGLWPVGYHVDNVVLHAISALVLWDMLDALAIPGGILAAALFALHPVHVESVAWVTERKNVLSGLLYLLSLRCFLRQGLADYKFDGRWYAAAAGLFIGALLSKSVACTLPLVILILAWWKTGRVDRRLLVALVPMLLLGLAMAIVTAYVEAHHVMAVGRDWDFTPADRVVIAGRAAWFYPWKLLWPTNLVFIYPKWTIDAHSLRQWSAPVMVMVVLGALWALRNRIGRGPLAAAMFYLVTILPALGFVNIFPMRYTFIADHYVYLASLGILVPITALIWELPDRSVIGVSVALVVVLVAATMARATAFLGPIPLWTDTIIQNPYAWMAHTNLALAYVELWNTDPVGSSLRAFDAQQAQEQYLIGEQLAPPGETLPCSALGMFCFVDNRLDESRRAFTKVVELDPDNAPAWTYLGDIQAREGNYQDAIATYRKAAEISHRPADLHLHMGIVDEQFQHNDPAAEAEYRAAIALDPASAPARIQLASVLLRRKAYDEAIEQLKTALDREPNHPEALVAMAVAYASKGDAADAISCAHDALELSPDFGPARKLLGQLEPSQPR